MVLLLADLGGTNLELAAWQEGSLTKISSQATPETYEGLVQALQEGKDFLEGKSQNPQKVQGLAMSTPGAVDAERGVIEGISAVPYIHHFPIRDSLAEALDLPVTIENDGNCAALAEWQLGSGRGLSSLMVLVLGTGIGGGLIINDALVRGHHLFAGEVGCQTQPAWPGNLSQKASPKNMVLAYQTRSSEGLLISGQELLDRAQAGDPLAQEILEGGIQALAHAIYNLVVTLDPAGLLLGGGISANSLYLSRLNQVLQDIFDQQGLPDVYQPVQACTFGNQANLYGARVAFAMEEGRSLL